jgi:hypothetical protein
VKRPVPPLTGPDPEAHSQIPSMQKINASNTQPDPASEAELDRIGIGLNAAKPTDATQRALDRIAERKRALDAGEIELGDEHPWDDEDELRRVAQELDNSIAEARGEQPRWDLAKAGRDAGLGDRTGRWAAPAQPPLSRAGRWAVGVGLLSPAVIALGPLVIVYWRWALG